MTYRRIRGGKVHIVNPNAGFIRMYICGTDGCGKDVDVENPVESEICKRCLAVAKEKS